MLRIPRVILVLGVSALLWAGWSAAPQTQSGSPSAGLAGTVKSADGKPLEGVPVSARLQGSRVTTSVWTNEAGEYSFAPLPAGRYQLWAQAVGFQFTRVELTVAAAGKAQQNITLPTYTESWKQLSDVEWFASLPDNTPEDRGVKARMKRVLLTNCGSCHNNGYVFAKRFTRPEWEMIVTHMAGMAGMHDPPHGRDCCWGADPGEGEIPGGGKFDKPMFDAKGRAIGAQQRIVEFYKKDIVDYLTRVRGPELFALNVRPLPRPTGEAANIIVTEYDVPERGTLNRLDPRTGEMVGFTLNRDGSTSRNDRPEYAINEFNNGTIWARGLPQGGGQHDLIVGTDGYVYLPSATGVGLDPAGNVFSVGGQMPYKFDIKTEKFTPYPKPEGAPGWGRGKDVDSKGNFWLALWQGAYRLNPNTKEWTLFRFLTKSAREYGLAIDARDNVWVAQIGVDKIAYVDGRTGDVGEVALPPVDEDMTEADRQLSRGSNLVTTLYQQGPRRLGADRNPNGRYVWTGNFFGGTLGKIDGADKKFVAVYKLPEPYRYGYPYDTIVDKNGMVWLSMANADAVARFDPRTERFTFYPLPTRGHNARHIGVDSKPEVPEVWIPYSNASKVARVQFRGAAGRSTR